MTQPLEDRELEAAAQILCAWNNTDSPHHALALARNHCTASPEDARAMLATARAQIHALDGYPTQWWNAGRDAVLHNASNWWDGGKTRKENIAYLLATTHSPSSFPPDSLVEECTSVPESPYGCLG